MAERFELSDLEDVPTFLELVEDAGDTAFITMGGRDRFVVVAAPKYARLRAEALQAEKRANEMDLARDEMENQLLAAEKRADDAESRVAELQRMLDAAHGRPAAAREGAGDMGGATASAVGAGGAGGTSPSGAATGQAAPSAGAAGTPASAAAPASGASGASDASGADQAPFRPSGACGSEPYVTAALPNTPIDSDDYQRSMWQEAITERMRKVIEAEAPVEKQRLFNTVRGSFGIKRSGRDIQAHNEWLFNRNIQARQTEFNGSTFVWRPDQDPQTYCIWRPYDEESGRQITEFAYQELAAAMLAALAGGRAYSRDELVEATMRLLGYKRKTTRVRDVIGAAIEQASNDGLIKLFTDGTFRS